MGMLVNGEWTTKWYTPDEKGRFVRSTTSFREHLSADGRFTPDRGRYRLYVSYACPWAHRTLLARALYCLNNAIDVSIVDHFMGEDGWAFSDNDGCIPDPDGAAFLRDVYVRAAADYTGRVTVPILWDTREQAIVNNESREIIRMLTDSFATPENSLAPAAMREDIDAAISAIYEPINNGVYKAGFATTQFAYEEAVTTLFAALDAQEDRLSRSRYLCGDRLTEADLCLFTTLIRFDAVYVCHFKCNLRRIVDYPNLSNYLRDVYQTPGVAETCNMSHIKQHYFRSHNSINPHRVVPVGPELDLDAPHDRARFS